MFSSVTKVMLLFYPKQGSKYGKLFSDVPPSSPKIDEENK